MEQGERGPKGDHGQMGDTGDTGVGGERGIVGERGDMGHQGSVGERGPKGDHGQHGEQGVRGIPGQLPIQAVIAIFVIILAFVVMGILQQRQSSKTGNLVRTNNHAIIELTKTKANVHQLQKSNCALRLFLLAARKRAYDSAQHEPAIKAAIDHRAFVYYTQIVVALDGQSYCPTPKNLQIK